MNPITTAVIQILQHAAFPIIAAVIAGFITVLIRKLSTRFHLGNLAGMDKILTKLAIAGVGIAEEHALASIKHSGIKITPDGKLDLAVSHILSAMPNIDRATARKYVDSAIAKIPGVGATGTKVIEEATK